MQSSESVPTYAAARSADSSQPHRKQTLIAMILATKTDASVVTERSMEIPSPAAREPSIGHQPAGRTIGLHSLAVLPAFQRQGLARVLVRSYQQRMETSGVADRIAILAHGPLTNMYGKLGFSDLGESETRHGGSSWNDMVGSRDFKIRG